MRRTPDTVALLAQWFLAGCLACPTAPAPDTAAAAGGAATPEPPAASDAPPRALAAAASSSVAYSSPAALSAESADVPTTGLIEQHVTRIEKFFAERGYATARDAPADLDQKIIHGFEGCEWDAVGAIFRRDRLHCSAVLIGQRTVLTAAHCLVEPASGTIRASRPAQIPSSDLGLAFTCDVTGARTLEPVEHVVTHPGYSAASHSNDVGVLCLKSRLAGIAPMRVAESYVAPAEFARKNIHLVGYGHTTVEVGRDRRLIVSGAGHRLRASLWAQPGDQRLIFNDRISNTCYLDSGGPAMLYRVSNVPEVVGITSNGSAVCQSYGVTQRIDTEVTRTFVNDSRDACERMP